MENPLAEIERIAAIADPGVRAVEAGRMLNLDLPEITTRVKAMRRAAVVEMHDVQGLTYDQIAEVLKVKRPRAERIAKGK